jgi:hypothetical protein
MTQSEQSTKPENEERVDIAVQLDQVVHLMPADDFGGFQ